LASYIERCPDELRARCDQRSRKRDVEALHPYLAKEANFGQVRAFINALGQALIKVPASGSAP